MPWKLSNLIDIPNLQMLMDRFHAATAIPVGIIASDGEILVATGWQEICTRFHRSHPVTADRCRQSDDYIKTRLTSENYVEYKCHNGLWDLAVPIIIAGEHVATLFLGQFFYEDEEIDEEFYLSQARALGFDEDGYMAALRRIPVYAREKVREIMEFYTSFVNFLVSTGVANRQRAETEKTLRVSEERYRTLFERANDAILTLRNDRCVSCNDKALELFRCTRDELIGATSDDFSPAVQPDGRDSSKKAADSISLALSGTPQLLEWRHLHKDGTAFDSEVSLSRLEYRGETELLVIIRDVTERRRAEEALRVSEAEKSLILNSTMDLVVYHDLDLKILWANRNAHDSVGTEPGGLTGRNCWEIWHQRTEPCHGCPVVLARDTGEPQEAEIGSFDGREWYIRGFPVKDDAGTIKGVVEFCLDITDRKKMEEKIEMLNTDLASRAQELEAANQELEAFNYSVTHDLRSPLMGIIGYSNLLLECSTDRLDAETLGRLRQISDSALHMDQLIGTMLRFSLLSRCEITRHAVDLTAMAKEVMARLRMDELCRQVTFSIAEGVTAEGDASLLRLVIENLLGNAWKYTARQETARIEFGVAGAAGGNIFFVRDDGPGFDMADAEKLFRPFERLPGTGDFAGHGIGLATVQRIIHRHGGRVWAEGEPGKGATFFFTL